MHIAHFLSSDGYEDGYQLNISLTSRTKVNFSDFELPSNIMAQLPITIIGNGYLYVQLISTEIDHWCNSPTTCRHQWQFGDKIQ